MWSAINRRVPAQVPLPRKFKTVIEDLLGWEEFKWTASGVYIRGIQVGQLYGGEGVAYV